MCFRSSERTRQGRLTSIMFSRRGSTGSNSQSTWPVLLLVLLAVLAPSACVLWFMEQAVRNEQLVVRQRLAELYRGRLMEAQSKLDAYWQDKLARLDAAAALTPARAFASLVRDGVAEAVIVLDAEGDLLYPQPDRGVAEAPGGPDWRAAIELEHEQGRFADAAARYARLAASATDADLSAFALLAQARCLLKAGQPAAAGGVLHTLTHEPRYRLASDPHGRSIVDDAYLLLLQLPGDRDRPEWREAAQALLARVNRYDAEPMPSSQRLFLMSELRSLIQPPPDLPTFEAEQLALDSAESAQQNMPAPGTVRFHRERSLWLLRASEGRRIALLRDRRVQTAMESLITAAVGAADVEVRLVEFASDPRRSDDSAFVTLNAGRFLAGHQLALFLRGANQIFADTARRRIALYTWTAWSGVLLIGVFGLLLARYMTRQIRLARLKNDLVATVSHELKTPLASMRALVETLSEGRCGDERQVREYYDLLARENERLSRLIDNFLTFSRMERNKRAFAFEELDLAEVIRAAVHAMHERLEPPGCELALDLPADLPVVQGDRDALVTVFLNLLDNAHKYSNPPRQIAIRARRLDGDIEAQVQDNGIGLSRRAARRVFERFYQVDQSLSRQAGGCGLGLSIVKFIVDAHAGTVSVASEPGRGSTFTVRLPAVDSSVRGPDPVAQRGVGD